MSNTTNLQLPMLEVAQAQKHVTVNETFQALDMLVQLTILDRNLNAPPGSINDGDRYIVGASATGDWAGQDGNIAAYQDGAWAFYNPRDGWFCWIADEDIPLVYDGSNWGTPYSEIILDADGDTSIHSSADDQIDFKVGGSDVFTLTATTIEATTSDGPALINESPSETNPTVLPNKARPTSGIAVDTASEAVIMIAGGVEQARYVSNGIKRYSSAGVVKYQLRRTGAATTGNTGFFSFQANSADTDNYVFGTFGARADTITADAEDGSWFFATSQGGATAATRMDIYAGVVVGSPTGGDQGHGTLNATAVYDDGALLSCYVFDAELDGVVDLTKWDGKVPDRVHVEKDEDGKVISSQTEVRTHEPAARFKQRMADDLNPDTYAAFWRANKHLPSMPDEAVFDPEKDALSIGSWTQRLIETVEVQAVHIDKLNERLKVLEGRPAQKA